MRPLWKCYRNIQTNTDVLRARVTAVFHVLSSCGVAVAVTVAYMDVPSTQICGRMEKVHARSSGLSTTYPRSLTFNAATLRRSS